MVMSGRVVMSCIRIVGLYHNCDSTTVYDDTTTHSTMTEHGSDRNYDMRSIRLRYDHDPTTTYRARLLPFDAIRREQKMNMSIFRRSRVVVMSQSNRTQIVISITSVVVECVVVSSYRSRIVVESQLL